jgi:hypothetical protein
MKSQYEIKINVDTTICIYTAGLLDGEGSVVIAKKKPRKPTQKTTYELSVGVGVCNKEAMEKLGDDFGASPYLKNRTKPKGKEYWSDYYYLQLHGNNAVRFLQQINPYLRIKKNRAELAFRFQQRMNARHNRVGGHLGNGNYLKDGELEVREQMYREMLTLNKRGKNGNLAGQKQ